MVDATDRNIGDRCAITGSGDTGCSRLAGADGVSEPRWEPS